MSSVSEDASLRASVSTPSTSSPFDNQSSPAGSTLATSMSSGSSQQGEEIKMIHCRWDNCQKTYDDPEDLYHHLCNDHVGRKSTNNLCLSCKWEGCDVTCAKRDHITSHLRVHTPLKPHACDACGKLFKRPQDLKKHERIHTEQHHQARQMKYQTGGPSSMHPYGMQHAMARFGMDGVAGPAATAAAAAAAAAASSGHHSMGGGWGGRVPYDQHSYHQSAPFYHQGNYMDNNSQQQQSMYPSLPGQQQRHVSPATHNSLSPLSSHLGTPSSGASPAANSYRGSITMSNDGYSGMQAERPKAHDDPNSYSYLAQGSSLAGSKRSHEATATFFDDVRRKRVAPTYDNVMAERLEHSFANGIDDATLHAILSSFGNNTAEPAIQGNSLYPSLDSHHQTPSTSTHSGQAKFSLPDAMKQTDLAELNAFLLQVGANAARTDANEQVNHHNHSVSSNHNSVDMSGFDFQAALAASGLTNIAGFDQSLLQMSQADLPSSSIGDTSSSSHGGDSWNRPIAHLPQRAMQSSYGSSNVGNMSFDNIRQSRVPSYVPQLGAKDMISPMYRHVEALTRAAPDVERSVSTPTMPRSKDADDESMSEAASSHEDDDRSSSSSSSRTTKTKDSSPGLNLYPRMSINDSSRRLPVPVSLERSSSDGSSSVRSTIPSITSILQDRPGQMQWRERQARASFSSSSPSPPPQTPPVNSSEPLYPSLRQESPSPSTGSSGGMEDVARDVAALDVENKVVSSTVRQNHARLIIQLLVALNDPERRKALAERETLAPLRLSSEDEDDRMDIATTPTLGSSRQLSKSEDGDDSRSDGTGSDQTANGKQKPSPPTIIRSHLPKISDLLNEVDSSAPPKGAGGRRIMDVDI